MLCTLLSLLFWSKRNMHAGQGNKGAAMTPCRVQEPAQGIGGCTGTAQSCLQVACRCMLIKRDACEKSGRKGSRPSLTLLSPFSQPSLALLLPLSLISVSPLSHLFLTPLQSLPPFPPLPLQPPSPLPHFRPTLPQPSSHNSRPPFYPTPATSELSFCPHTANTCS